MHDALGVGLAAPQLGISQRLLVYRVGPDAPVIALANPEIEWASGERRAGRGGLPVDPRRRSSTSTAPSTCACAALDEEGEERVVEASGLEARVIQHEIDHLDGVLILERTTREERKRALRELREAEQRRDEAA